jgi:hypothetical protein
MPHLITAIDWKTREQRTFTLYLNPILCFKVNAEQEINFREHAKSKGRHWSVLEMQPLMIAAPF